MINLVYLYGSLNAINILFLSSSIVNYSLIISFLILQEIRRRGLKVSVAGIPKTIDNDIPVLLILNNLWISLYWATLC